MDLVLYYGPALINGFNHAININVEKVLKSTKQFALYEGTRFRCYIWWAPTDGLWYAEIWNSGSFALTIKSVSIQGLAYLIDEKLEAL